jgi:hypothetical protein
MKLNVEKIKAELLRIEKTQTWLADQMGCTRQAVTWLFTKNVRSFEPVERIAKVLNMDPKDLIM